MARRPTMDTITMASATGELRTSIVRDRFNLPLPSDALDFHVFKDGNIQRPLLSVGKACDAGCTVTFGPHQCTFTKDDQLLLMGCRDYRNSLYLLPNHPNATAYAGVT